jgi:hypothetical protein
MHVCCVRRLDSAPLAPTRERGTVKKSRLPHEPDPVGTRCPASGLGLRLRTSGEPRSIEFLDKPRVSSLYSAILSNQQNSANRSRNSNFDNHLPLSPFLCRSGSPIGSPCLSGLFFPVQQKKGTAKIRDPLRSRRTTESALFGSQLCEDVALRAVDRQKNAGLPAECSPDVFL